MTRESKSTLELRPNPNYLYGLNQRATEVLRLIAAGESNREIGGDLFVTPKTVARPVSSIFLKIASSNRVEATFSATQTGLA